MALEDIVVPRCKPSQGAQVIALAVVGLVCGTIVATIVGSARLQVMCGLLTLVCCICIAGFNEVKRR